MAIVLGAAICLLSGFFASAAFLPRSHKIIPSSLMKLSLAAGFGLGISSCVFFVMRMISFLHFFAIDILVLTALLFLYLLIRIRLGKVIAAGRSIPDFDVPRWLELALTGSFVVAIVAALYCSRLRMLAHEHGEGWDAFAIWNLHARFLYLGGDQWRNGFNALTAWSHPDYPLLLPAAIARLWGYSGHDNPMVPAVIGIAFALSTVTLLVSSLVLLRGRNAAKLSGLALLATPFFIQQGTAQYADVPLAFFILTSIVLVQFGFRNYCDNGLTIMRGPWLLAGLSAGLAAWTKNEGLLFLVAMIVAHSWAFFHRSGVRRIPESLAPSERTFVLPFVLGTLPVLAVILWFKHSVATPGDLFSSPTVMLEKILTPSRYAVILRWYGKELFRFGEWWLVPQTFLLPVFYVLLRPRKPILDPFLRPSIATLALTCAGYFVIYLITPRDLYWHLRFSLNRLFLQLWPAALFLFFRFVGSSAPQTSQNEPEIP